MLNYVNLCTLSFSYIANIPFLFTTIDIRIDNVPMLQMGMVGFR